MITFHTHSSPLGFSCVGRYVMEHSQAMHQHPKPKLYYVYTRSNSEPPELEAHHGGRQINKSKLSQNIWDRILIAHNSLHAALRKACHKLILFRRDGCLRPTAGTDLLALLLNQYCHEGLWFVDSVVRTPNFLLLKLYQDSTVLLCCYCAFHPPLFSGAHFLWTVHSHAHRLPSFVVNFFKYYWSLFLVSIFVLKWLNSRSTLTFNNKCFLFCQPWYHYVLVLMYFIHRLGLDHNSIIK